MERDDAYGDDEPQPPLLPPDDRLWRHPSEVAAHGLPFEDAAPPSRAPRMWAVAVLAAAVSALLTVGVVAVTGGLRQRVRTIPAVERIALPAGSLSTAFGPARPGVSELGDRLRPSIVALEVERESGTTAGSGVMFRSDGHLLTNHHVVDGANAITAVMADGRTASGRVVGSDQATDIAVVQVEDWVGVPTAPLGSAAGLRVGQEVMVVGGGGPAWVCQVQALGRPLDRVAASTLVDMIQTDAPIRASSSGGALVDASGAVVGITTVGATPDGGVAGTGYATPIDFARSVAEQLLATGAVVRVWMGIDGSDLDQATAGRMGVDGGAMVGQVRDASPAADAGLAPGDVITSADAVPVGSMAALRILLRAHRPGDMVKLQVVRRGAARAVNVDVRLAERPAQE